MEIIIKKVGKILIIDLGDKKEMQFRNNIKWKAIKGDRINIQSQSTWIIKSIDMNSNGFELRIVGK